MILSPLAFASKGTNLTFNLRLRWHNCQLPKDAKGRLLVSGLLFLTSAVTACGYAPQWAWADGAFQHQMNRSYIIRVPGMDCLVRALMFSQTSNQQARAEFKGTNGT